jgi:transcriptional regulator with XRE-family HTH domain
MRLYRDLSQAAISKETGIPFWTVSRLEAGLVKPKPEQKAKLAAALRVSENYLFPPDDGGPHAV